MADYKELLRKAIDALPENNGAARRAVYEKARAALVGQLRAINPPLAARDITTHRLQLEDCIRQVEQEASEAVIAGLGMQDAPPPPPPPVFFTNNAPPPTQQNKPAAQRVQAMPMGREMPKPIAVDAGSIEAIIAAADKDNRAPEERPSRGAPRGAAASGRGAGPRLEPRKSMPEPEPAPPPPAKAPSRPVPAIVARAEAAKSRPPQPPAYVAPAAAEKSYDKSYDNGRDAGRRGPVAEPRREPARTEQSMRGQQAAARHMVPEPTSYRDDVAVPVAMSSVREVEVEPAPVDPQGAIDRAIATLDREARDTELEPRGPSSLALVDDDEDYVEPAPQQTGKKGLMGGMFGKDKGKDGSKGKARAEAPVVPAPEPPPEPPAARPGKAAKPVPAGKATNGKATNGKAAATGKPTRRDGAFPKSQPEPRRGGASAVTMFLLVFLVLLAGAGGAGYWAWQEGYVDIEAVFRGNAPVAVADVPANGGRPVPAAPVPVDAAVGPGNTATPPPAAAPATELREERLVATPAPVPATPAAVAPLQLQASGNGARVPERLGETPAGSSAQAAATVAGLDPATTPGSQSLLLEAADAGSARAMPFSGTVDWSRGQDETGAPTLIGKANIPARNLGVDLLIRKNSDPTLPASHLMEINFSVPETFVGGSIAGLPGVLLKNEELRQGVPLVGASARVVGNTFLFALSSSPEDTANNNALLTSRKWMDLAVIYATGKRAILTLEKDSAAETLFRDVFAAWGTVPVAAGAPARAGG